MLGSLPGSHTLRMIGLAGIVGACTPARHEVQTDVVKSVEFHGNGGFFSFDQSDYLLSGAMEQGDSPWGATVFPLMYWVVPEGYDAEALDGDAWRLEVWYAHHGWFDARFDGWEVIRTRPRRAEAGGVVKIVGHVDPGEPSVVGDYDITGLERPVHAPFESALRRTGPIQPGNRFEIDDLDGTEAQLLESLARHGFPYASVASLADVHPEDHAVDVSLDVHPGVLARFGPVTVSGNEAVAERVIRDSLSFSPGETWDSRELATTQDHLFRLGTFAVVNVSPDLSDPTRTEVPVDVSVSEAEFQTLRLGGGLSYQGATLTPRLSLEYRHTNLFHRLLQVRLKGSLGYGFRPQRGRTGFLEGTPIYAVSLEASTPYLGSPDVGLFVGGGVEQDIQSGQYAYFNPTARAGFRWRPRDDMVLTVGPEFELYKFRDLDIEGLLFAKQIFGPDFQNPYTLTKLALHTSWDLRDDPVSPTRGAYFVLGAEQAFPVNRWFGGEGGFLYTQVNGDARFYTRPRLGSRLPLVGAVRVQAKALFPWAANAYLPYSEKAFLGGASSLRGFLVDQVGPYDCVCTHESAEVGNGFALDPGAGVDPVVSYLPRGGVVGASAMGEVRWTFSEAQSVAAFADVGVLIERSEVFDATSLRVGAGVGYRYDTSIGPFRLDIGLRPLYPEDEGPLTTPGCTVADDVGARSFDAFGAVFPKQRDLDLRSIPFALNLYVAIGEAF